MAGGEEVTQLPVPCVVVLVGPSGAGKSTWAAAHFEEREIVSSDLLRAVIGQGEDDLDATDDAFALLDTIVTHRVNRRLTTVVDTLGLDPDRRRRYRELAEAHGLACVAVAFDIAPDECRARNRQRLRPLPATALKQQLARWAEVRSQLATEGFARVLDPVGVRPVPGHLTASAPLSDVQRARPATMRFGLHLSTFPWDDIAGGLAATATAAEQAGFESIWVMDHVRQIPQVGRDWDPMLESYTALAWLAASTSTVRLGALVTAITFRNVGHLGKIIATLDVLSGGRAQCGLGLAWYEREHQAYGWDFPAPPDRYRLLEDALQALPRLWGPGSKPFEGQVLNLPDTTCYPRPLQERVPILVGGGGETRTLRLAARHADAVNVMGTIDTVRHKVEVLRRHCADADRDPAEVAVTHLAPALVGADRREAMALVDRHRPPRVEPDDYAARVNAGTVEDHIGRVRGLADAGVNEVIVSLPDLGSPGPGPSVEPVERFGAVISAFPRVQ
jgi:F420-dependent oxidoreductase-like protein